MSHLSSAAARSCRAGANPGSSTASLLVRCKLTSAVRNWARAAGSIESSSDAMAAPCGNRQSSNLRLHSEPHCSARSERVDGADVAIQHLEELGVDSETD